MLKFKDYWGINFTDIMKYHKIITLFLFKEDYGLIICRDSLIIGPTIFRDVVNDLTGGNLKKKVFKFFLCS